MTTEDVLMEYRKRLSIRETARELDIGDALPQGIRISIHTPLTGCDHGIYEKLGATKEFQSTHPSRGATTRQTGMFTVF